MKEITLEQLFSHFDPEVHDAIRKAILRNNASHLVVFECLQMDSSNLGKRTALCVGPTCTYTLDHVINTPHFRIGDVPSRFEYPTMYAPTGEHHEKSTETHPSN